ncbi:MAG: hypothetical protein AVDCRST_MAG40-3106 [uncultured Gemmatimonadaceae bacterium]|uniref:Uncharacterized protein n=1 Tax=uncultured Gemmatimonadaceae bacterium TaxID=246130 RepID=A0A6J4MBK5_9BACT|nr:MAG: hypothetical protein AVDCRST_MAG40-3106 [uncultured Gemmatimonadaceae bacterium]
MGRGEHGPGWDRHGQVRERDRGERGVRRAGHRRVRRVRRREDVLPAVTRRGIARAATHDDTGGRPGGGAGRRCRRALASSADPRRGRRGAARSPRTRGRG